MMRTEFTIHFTIPGAVHFFLKVYREHRFQIWRDWKAVLVSPNFTEYSEIGKKRVSSNWQVLVPTHQVIFLKVWSVLNYISNHYFFPQLLRVGERHH